MHRLILICAVLTAMGGFWQSALAQDNASTQSQKSQNATMDSAPIQTRNDLIAAIADRSPQNPMNFLSADARQRLLDNSTFNKENKISSIWVDDIRQLTPSQSFAIFSLFGSPEIARKENNGRVETEMDRQILGMKKNKVSPAIDQKYCNGGYCTNNPDLYCYENRCIPPRAEK